MFVLRETTLCVYDRKHQEQKKSFLTLNLEGGWVSGGEDAVGVWVDVDGGEWKR